MYGNAPQEGYYPSQNAGVAPPVHPLNAIFNAPGASTPTQQQSSPLDAILGMGRGNHMLTQQQGALLAHYQRMIQALMGRQEVAPRPTPAYPIGF